MGIILFVLLVLSGGALSQRVGTNDVTCETGTKYPLLQESEVLYDCGTGRYWVFTMDDIPQEHTLDMLAQYGIKVTFFVEGNTLDHDVESRPRLKRARQEGHDIQHHSYTHNNFAEPPLNRNCSAIKWEMDTTNALIRTSIGESNYKPTYFRPPFGSIDDFSGSVISGMGYKIVQWNLDPEDWRETEVTATDVLNTVQQGINQESIILDPNFNQNFFRRRGSILMLAHDRPTNNVYYAMFEAIPRVWRAGFKIVTVPQCWCLYKGGNDESCGVAPIPDPIPQFSPPGNGAEQCQWIN